MDKRQLNILSEIESSIHQTNSLNELKDILIRFEETDSKLRDNHFPHLYYSMWEVALKIGKLNLANLYAKKVLDYLLKYKRVPALKKVIPQFLEAGLLKKEIHLYIKWNELLLGKGTVVDIYDFPFFELMEEHSEQWKFQSDLLHQYLLESESWTPEHWKLCYEFILKNGFEKKLFLLLFGKIQDFNSEKFEKKFIELFNQKKVKFKKRLRHPELESHLENKNSLNVDYDQVALDLLSGSIAPDDLEQRRVLNSLKFIPNSELELKGQDMIMAFELLGMNQVVIHLCEKVININENPKILASTYYVWVQSLINTKEFYKAIDLIDEINGKIPLVEQENLAFMYLKAEIYFNLKKYKLARDIYLKIKKINPNFRLLKERLGVIETLK